MQMKEKYRKFEQITLRAKQLRQVATPAEKIFWSIVRRKSFCGKKFYRQYPVSYDYNGRTRFFILDFYCHEDRIAVELDGSVHANQKEYDQIRSRILEAQGIRVVRFLNHEVLRPDLLKDKLMK